ncbi:hypothetical protein ALC57_06572 [Trachymyrmex cornetzi]|uniref:Uncharacterized protein n=1 Tax=Trachymyrmex cornetzi TaxID=471704 RepID=A0A151J8B9_9HYME|nr:hypothetical protein ALC57_06572 [Trachymyrmex cornetzi]
MTALHAVPTPTDASPRPGELEDALTMPPRSLIEEDRGTVQGTRSHLNVKASSRNKTILVVRLDMEESCGDNPERCSIDSNENKRRYSSRRIYRERRTLIRMVHGRVEGLAIIVDNARGNVTSCQDSMSGQRGTPG